MFFLSRWRSLLAALPCALLISGAAGAKNNAGRVLTPARRTSSILSRSDSIGTCIHSHERVELSYAQDNNVHGESNYAAKVTVLADKPLLVLEEVEHLLNDIVCSPDSITISLASRGDEPALQRLSELIGGHIITSHSGCNEDSERQAYSVIGAEVTTSSSVVYVVTPVSFNSAFRSIDVEIGHTKDGHELRHDLVRRDGSYSLSLSGLSVSNAVIYNKGGNIPVDIICKECTLYGELEIDLASWSWNCDSVYDIESPSDCITGEATATATGLGAKIDLGVQVAGSWEHDFPLLPSDIQLPNSHIYISGIGGATLYYGPYLHVGYVMNGSIGMSYGFTSKVPDGAKFFIDVTTLSDSGASGFDGTTIDVIPFQSSAEIQSVAVYTALRSQVGIKFDFQGVEDISGDGEALVFVDTPILRAKITPLQDVDVDCQPGASSKIKNILTSVIKIALSMAWDVGYVLSFDISDLSSSPLGNTTTTAPRPLTQQCLNFNQQTQSYETTEQAVGNTANARLSQMSAALYALTLAVMLFSSL